MPRRLQTTYGKLNRIPPPQPEPENESHPLADSFSGDSYYEEAEVTVEMAQFAGDVPPLPDSQQAAYLESYNMARDRETSDRVFQQMNDSILERQLEISLERAPTEEAGRLLMAAEREKLLELDARRHAEAATREETRLRLNEESRLRRARLKRQRRRTTPPTPEAHRHRQMLKETVARREAAAAWQAKAENDGEAGPLRAPAVNE